jgi:hypothetical protein
MRKGCMPTRNQTQKPKICGLGDTAMQKKRRAQGIQNAQCEMLNRDDVVVVYRDNALHGAHGDEGFNGLALSARSSDAG